jgi:two-component system, NtrC family, sensor kinase
VRLTWKLTIGILAGVTIALAVNLTLRMEREEAVFLNDMRQDHALLASWLASDLLEEWRENGPTAAREVLGRRAAALRSPEQLRVKSIEPDAIPREALPLLQSRAMVHDIIEFDGVTTLRTLAPVLDRGVVVLALELDESMAGVDAYLRTTLWRAFVSFLAMLVGVTGVVAVFGFVVVGRPVQLLVEKARRTGRGDLSGPVVLATDDELATIGRALNDMCDQLKAALAERDAAAEARIAAVERLRHVDRLGTMGTLAAGLAHELGTPLHVIASRAQLTLDNRTANDADRKNARIVVEQASQMTRIVRHLLDFARQRPASTARIGGGAIAGRVVEMLSMLAKKQNVRLTLTIHDGDVDVIADAGLIEQALTNLVVNAIQASPAQATVTVDVRRVADAAPAPEIGGPPRDEVWLAVVDHAGGIAEAHREQLFTPFFTTKGVGEGTGLGLAIAWGLVREHDGTIVVDSVVGAGSTFTIRLPAAPAHASVTSHHDTEAS